MPAIIETVNITHEAAWLPWAVFYFFFAALAFSAAIISTAWTLLRRSGWKRAARMTLLVLLSSAIVAPVALLADLHQPGRFWHFYTHFTPWSWMSWGALFLPLFVALAIVYSWLALTQPQDGRLAWAIRPLAMATLAFALLVALYTGMEVMVVKARPIWNTALLPWAYLFTGLMGAAGLALVVDAFIPGDHATAERKLSKVMGYAALLSLLTLGLWLAEGLTGISDAAARTIAAISGSAYWRMIGLALALSLALPILGFFIRGLPLAVLGLIAVAAMWAFRWVVFMDGQMIPKTGAGLYAYRLPMGADGLLGIIGIIGLWLAVIIIVTTITGLAPRQGAAQPAE